MASVTKGSSVIGIRTLHAQSSPIINQHCSQTYHNSFTYCWSSISRARITNWEGVVLCKWKVPDLLSVASSCVSSTLRSSRVTPFLYSAPGRGTREKRRTGSRLIEWVGLRWIAVVGIHHGGPGVDNRWVERIVKRGHVVALDNRVFPGPLKISL